MSAGFDNGGATPPPSWSPPRPIPPPHASAPPQGSARHTSASAQWAAGAAPGRASAPWAAAGPAAGGEPEGGPPRELYGTAPVPAPPYPRPAGERAPVGVAYPAGPVPPPPPAHPPAAAWSSPVPPSAQPPYPPRPPHAPTHPPPARPRTAAAALCLVLGLSLLGGAGAGVWINHDPAAPTPTAAEASRRDFALARGLWHSTPVDTLFPATLHGKGLGPGGAERTWTRIGVAPAGDCREAFDPLLAKVLRPAGCVKLLRATYADATSSAVTTVGLLVTKAEAPTMRKLHNRWISERLGSRGDLMPRPVAFPGTVADGFGDRQRASWTVTVAADLPVVVYAVSGFADGREIAVPQPAASAVSAGATTAPAQAGLGHEADALADAVADRARRAAGSLTATPTGGSG
ncbi:hypothetical protein ABZ461_10555 [Actinacidiphila glaucinigra]|uniref:hypothetical protein n=1 Tax=Actinacidiphila glaucinigra TaxID=235986 RepID=UPI00340A3095